MTPDQTDADKAVLIELLRETIERDRFPLSPRIKRLKAVLAKLDPPAPCSPRLTRRYSMTRRLLLNQTDGG
jgi:hypothetical protein